MPSTQLPKLGLYKGWSLNEKGWDQEMNANLCKLDAMVAVGVTGQVATADLPVSGNQGEQYLLTETNEIATFQGGAWLKCPIPKGLPILDCAAGSMYTFDGASVVPMVTEIPKASVADVLAGVPDLFVDALTLCDSFNDIFGAGVITGIVPPTAAPGPKELPIYCDTVTSQLYAWDGAAWVTKSPAEPPFTITYDEAGAGAASADLFVKTNAAGCIDPKLVKGYPTYPSTTAFETAIGGAGNLVGGERMYDPALGVPVYYNAVTGTWEPETREPLKKAHYNVDGGPNQVFNNAVAQDVLWTNTLIDDFGGGMNAAGTWTVPAGCDGCYLITYETLISVFTAINMQGGSNNALWVNGVLCSTGTGEYWVARETAGVQRSHLFISNGATTLDLAVGDQLKVSIYQINTPSGLAMGLNNAKSWSSFKIMYLGRR